MWIEYLRHDLKIKGRFGSQNGKKKSFKGIFVYLEILKTFLNLIQKSFWKVRYIIWVFENGSL